MSTRAVCLFQFGAALVTCVGGVALMFVSLAAGVTFLVAGMGAMLMASHGVFPKDEA